MTGRVTEDRQIVLDSPIPVPAANRVRVLVLLEGEEDIPESEWQRFLSTNPAFADVVADEADYTMEDGKPFRAEG